jgi:tRNA-(ms[2]io[6]A)-hydroxylase
MGVLRLQLPTDPRWVNIVEKKYEEILTDHAWCEQKQLQSCNLIIQNIKIVQDLLALAKENDHFEQVHNIIIKRG